MKYKINIENLKFMIAYDYENNLYKYWFYDFIKDEINTFFPYTDKNFDIYHHFIYSFSNYKIDSKMITRTDNREVINFLKEYDSKSIKVNVDTYKTELSTINDLAISIKRKIKISNILNDN